jgi:hypothetical protein
VRVLVFALMLVLLAARSQADLPDSISSPENEAVVKTYVDHLRAGHYEEIERALDPSVRDANTREALEKMAGLVPSGEPASVKVVGDHTFVTPEAKTVSTTLEYEFGEKWLLASVTVRERSGARTIVGFNVIPMQQSLEALHRFTLSGKSALHYAVLVASLAAVSLSIYALIACARAAGLPRKWAWVLFILVGFGTLALNWTTGEWRVELFRVQLLSAAFTRPLYGPWTLQVSLPLGAILFLLRRKSGPDPE